MYNDGTINTGLHMKLATAGANIGNTNELYKSIALKSPWQTPVASGNANQFVEKSYDTIGYTLPYRGWSMK